MPRRQKIANIEESTRHVHHPSPSQQQQKIRTIKPIHHPTEQFDKNQGRIESTWQVHILRSPLMDHIQLSTSIKRYIIIRFESTTTVDEPSERSRCSSPYTIARPSTHTKHTSLCTTQTKVMGNHRMHPQETIIYIIRTSRKNQEPHRKARRRIPRLPHPMKTIKNNLHHRT